MGVSEVKGMEPLWRALSSSGSGGEDHGLTSEAYDEVRSWLRRSDPLGRIQIKTPASDQSLLGKVRDLEVPEDLESYRALICEQLEKHLSSKAV